MHLFITLQSLLEEFLGIKFTEIVAKELSEDAGLSPRQIKTYLTRGRFSPGISHKLKYRFLEKGVSIPDEIYDQRFATPISWKAFFEAVKKKEDNFLPRTYRLIREFADQDIVFLKQIQPLSLDNRFSAYRKYLIGDIIPLYCLDPDPILDMVRNSKNEKELKQPQYRIFLESLLYLLSFAESEYMDIYSLGNDSILSKVLPERDTNNIVISSSPRLFQKWMETLQLDSKAFVQEMIDHFGETGISCSDSQDDNLECLSKEGLRQNLSRYLKKGKYPSWAMIEKLAIGLHHRAMEIQGRNDNHTEYCEHVKDIYGGVRILDKLYKVACEVLPEREVLEVMSTYQARYAMHTAAIKKEAS